MKLRLLHESAFTTGAIAIRPAIFGRKESIPAPEKENKLVGQPEDDRWYLKFSKTSNTNITEEYQEMLDKMDKLGPL